VVTELTENIAGWERIKSALDEIRACHGDTLNFFDGIFSQLNSLSESLLTREQLLEKQAALRRADISAPAATDNNFNNERWDSLHKEFEEDRTEISSTQNAIQRQIEQISTAVANLDSARCEFQSVRGELAQHNEELKAISADNDRWDSLHKELEDDRAELSGAQNAIKQQIDQVSTVVSDLASTRSEFQSLRAELTRHSGDLMAVLSQTLAASGQNQSIDELREIRTMLETLSKSIAEKKRQAEPATSEKSASGFAAVASSDPVLESVLSQFELLQHDRFQRRSETVERKK
jgi:chromosome segregation ATPase